MPTLKRILKFFAWAVGILLLLLIILMLLLRVPAVQNKILQTAIPTIEELLGGADVEIGRIDLDLFDTASVEGILIRDLRGDTLVFARELGVDIGVFSLFGAELFVDEVRLEGAVVNAYQLESDSAFNYQFIIDAFAPAEPNAVDTSAYAFTFGLRTVLLENTRVRLLDEHAPSDLNVKLGKFEVDIQTLDLDNLAVDIANVEVADLQGSYLISKDESGALAAQSVDTTQLTETTFPFADLPISVGQLSLKQIDFSFVDENRPKVELGIDPSNIDVQYLFAEASDFKWDSTSIALTWDELSFRERSGVEVNKLAFDFECTDRSLDLENFTFKTSESAIQATAAIDFTNFGSFVNLDPSTKVNLQFQDSYVSFHDIQLLAPMLEDAGLNLNTTANIFLDGAVSGSFSKLNLDGLNVRLGRQTALMASGLIINPLDPDKLSYNLKLSKLTSSYTDLKRLTKGIELPAGLADLGRFSFSGSLKGTTADLDGKNLNLKTQGRTMFLGDLSLSNLDDTDNLFIDAQVKSLQTNAEELKSFIPDSLAVDLLALGDVDFTGSFKGSLTDFVIDGKLNSALGSLMADLNADFNEDYSDGTYEGALGLTHFDLGTFLRDTTLGLLTLDLKLDGSGLSVEDIASKLEGKIGEFTYLGYTYHDIDFNGRLNEEMFQGFFKIDDENLKLTFKGRLDLNENTPEFVFNAELDTIALQPLNLYSEPFGLSSSIKADLRGNSIDNIAGKFHLDTIRLQNGEKTAFLDHLFIEAKDTSSGRYLELNSDVLRADIIGQFTIEELVETIVLYIDSFFPISDYVRASAIEEQIDEFIEDHSVVRKPQDFAFRFELDDPTEIVALFDDNLVALDTASFIGTFNPEDKLDAKFYLPGIDYAGTMADSVLAVIYGEKKDLLIKTRTVNLTVADRLVHAVNADVNLGRDSLLFTLAVFEDADSTVLETQLAVTDNKQGRYVASFTQDLDIIGELWEIDRTNTIEYWNNYLKVENLNFSHEGQRILIASGGEGSDGKVLPITLDIENYRLSELEPLVPIDSFTLTGLANGNVTVEDPFGALYYTANLKMNDIVMNGEPVGDFVANASSEGLDELLVIDVRLDGSINDLAIAGTYDINNGAFDLSGNVAALELRLIDPLAVGVLSNTEGLLKSKIDIKGSLDEPLVNGFLAFDKASTTVELLGTQLKINDSRIDISEGLFDFNTFVLTDSLDQTATITGTIAHKYFSDFLLDLDLKTDRFKVLGTEPNLDELYYGDVFAEIDAEITGDFDVPLIRGTASTLDGTAITIVPLLSVNAVSQEDWVIYGNPETFVQDSTLENVYNANKLGLDVRIVVKVKKDALLNVLIDPLTGDALVAHGDAELAVSMSPEGIIEVTGLYEIDRGSYRFTLPTLGIKLKQYEFEMKKGSYMRFIGDPLDSRFDITAIYKTETTTFELLELDGSATEGAQAASAQRRQEVDVNMELEGTFDEPDINLSIEVPESGGTSVTNDVQRILNGLSEQDTYEQVFSLLVFNSFNAFGGSSTASPGNQGAAIAINSLSTLVSKQLNKLADKAIGGFDVNIGVDSYVNRYDNGSIQNTAKVDLSRTLLNDRLTVTIGTDVNVSSNNSLVAGNNASAFQSNFTLRYRLTENGRYFVSVFRRPDFDIISTNSPFENGVGVSYSKKFN